MKDFLILTLLFLAGFSKANACNVMGPTNFAFSTSLENERGAFFDPDDNRVIEPEFLLTGCSKTKRKYLQLSLGVVEDYINNGSNISAIHESFEPAACRVIHSPLKNIMTKEEIVKNFLQKRKYLTSCFEITVSSANGGKLFIPEQSYCEFELVGDNKYLLKGNLCYLEIGKQSSFIFDLKPKSECLKKDFFLENKIELQDLLAHLGFNVSDTSDGSGKNMLTVAAAMIRMSQDPNSKLMLTSDDYGRVAPKFPGVWVIPNVHAGAVKVSQNGDFKEVSVDLVVDNRCKRICDNDGLCSSPCNYSSPVAAEVELYQVPLLPVIIEEDEEDDFFDDFDEMKILKSSREYVDSWYTGGVAQANWQGIIPGNKVKIKSEYLPVGKRYEAILTFRGPKLDYQFLMKKYRSLLPPLPDFASLASGIPMEISGVQTNLGNIAESLSSGSMSEAIKKLHSLFSYTAWPIFVDKVCDTSLTKCKKTERKDNLRLSVGFDVTEEFFDVGNELKISNIIVKRQSPILKSSIEKRDFQPEIFCEVE